MTSSAGSTATSVEAPEPRVADAAKAVVEEPAGGQDLLVAIDRRKMSQACRLTNAAGLGSVNDDGLRAVPYPPPRSVSGALTTVGEPPRTLRLRKAAPSVGAPALD